MQCQWSRMISTRKPKVLGIVSAQDKDILPIVKAQIKRKNVSIVYVDGAMQVSVMSENMMHCLGLEVSNPYKIKANMATNEREKIMGIVERIKLTMFGTQVVVDIYVLPINVEGYPIILGRPWLCVVGEI